MSWLDDVAEPTEAELWAIEAEAEILIAELSLVEAETALFTQPGKAAAAAYLQALIDVVDLHDFTDDWPGGAQLDIETPALTDWFSITETIGAAL